MQNRPLLAIELCMGSSCFCRGNRTLAAELKNAIVRRGWTDLVEIKGCLCRDACSTGPHVRINGVSTNVRTAAVLESRIDEQLSVAKSKPGDG
jgi:NADH:ubiquinone oxidoreductase subunit E